MTQPPDQQPPEQPFDEESLLRALRAPGSEAELGDEEEYAAMFRAARDADAPTPVPLAPHRRRVAGRLGAGSAFVVVLAIGGSAAAAYTNHLPEPIQRLAHRALGPVAPPAPEDRHRPDRDRTTTAPATAPTPTPSATPTPPLTPSLTPSPAPTHRPSATDSTAPVTPSATPTVTPTPTPTPTQSASPSATATPTPSPTPPPPPVAAAVGVAGSTHQVEPGQSVTFSGTVTAADGTPVPLAKVALQASTGDGWSVVASARSDASGQVALVLPPVARTTAVRLRTAGAHSPRWRVTLHPELAVTSAVAATNDAVLVTATATGGQPGDTVLLFSKAGQVGTGTLESGTVTFSVVPTQKKTRYVVVLPATSAHGADRASITVIVKKPAPQAG